MNQTKLNVPNGDAGIIFGETANDEHFESIGTGFNFTEDIDEKSTPRIRSLTLNLLIPGDLIEKETNDLRVNAPI